jgi:hypothetical protein
MRRTLKRSAATPDHAASRKYVRKHGALILSFSGRVRGAAAIVRSMLTPPAFILHRLPRCRPTLRAGMSRLFVLRLPLIFIIFFIASH